MSIVNGPIFSSDGNGVATTSSESWFIGEKGDTFRIQMPRSPVSNANGLPGEFCWGTVGGINYIYVCVANNTWGRAALITGY